MFVCSAVLGGIYLLVSLYLQLVEGLSPPKAGLWLLIPIGAATIGSMAAPMLTSRLQPSRFIAGTLGTAVIGLVVLSVGGGPHLAGVVVGFSLLNLGIVPLIVFTTGLTLGSVPPEQAGAASGVSETGGELGFALGVAVLGSLGTVVYRGQVTSALPSGTSGATRDTVTSSLANATAEHVADGLLSLARNAFSDGFAVVSVISAIVLAGLAAGGAILLWHLRASDLAPPPEGEPAPEPATAAAG
jgi:DHA2 family multidrug resistance protein-like MFS transporter